MVVYCTHTIPGQPIPAARVSESSHRLELDISLTSISGCRPRYVLGVLAPISPLSCFFAGLSCLLVATDDEKGIWGVLPPVHLDVSPQFARAATNLLMFPPPTRSGLGH